MKARQRQLWLMPTLLAALAFGGGGGAVPAALAQVDEEEKIDYSALKRRRTPTIGNRVYEKLATAQKRIEEKDAAGARAILDSLLRGHRRREPLSGYELANVWNTYAYVYSVEENYSEALQAYQRVISDLDVVPYQMFLSTQFIIAQLHLVLENYPRAIKELLRWMEANDNPAPNAWFLLAQAYFQNEQKDAALQSAQRGVAVAERRGVEMREQWLLLLRSLHIEREEWDEALEIVQTLVQNWPKARYWIQLSNMFGQLGRQREQMVSMETADAQRLLEKEKDIVRLAYLLLAEEMPYKAAKLLSAGLESGLIEETSKHLELCGSAWQNARELERALPILERAAELAEDGNIYSRLAGAYMDQYRYKDAIRAADAAFKKGDLKRPDTLAVVHGLSLFHLQRYGEALDAFEEARKDERSIDLADEWQVYIRKEIARQKWLKKDAEAEQKEFSLFDLNRGT